MAMARSHLRSHGEMPHVNALAVGLELADSEPAWCILAVRASGYVSGI